MSIFVKHRKLWSFYSKLFITHFSSLVGGYVLNMVIPESFSTYNFVIGLCWLGIGFFLIVSLFGRRPTLVETVHWRQSLYDLYTKDYWKSRDDIIIVGATFAVFGLLMIFLAAGGEEPIVFFLAIVGLISTLSLNLYLRKTLES